MTATIETRGLTKAFGSVRALDDVDITFRPDTIHGLLGRNGSGKTTLMSILTAQQFATSGSVRVFGESPYENQRVLSRLCFVRESQKYPDSFTPRHAFASARTFFPGWDDDFAGRLIDDFDVPLDREIQKLSRGQFSAVGVVIGLATRAEATFFDEPYLGLDAVAREIFYSRLLEDYAAHPRTIVLSSHLIDEIAAILEHVTVLDRGRVVLDGEVDEIRGRASTVIGPEARVDEAVAGLPVLHREAMGSFASVTVDSPLSPAQRDRAAGLGLEIAPVSLQQLVVRMTTPDRTDAAARPSASETTEVTS